MRRAFLCRVLERLTRHCDSVLYLTSRLRTVVFRDEDTLILVTPTCSITAVLPQVLGTHVSGARTVLGLCIIADENLLTTLSLLRTLTAGGR